MTSADGIEVLEELLPPEELLLPAELHHFPVGIRVLGQHERRARRRPILRHQPAGLVADAAGVAQRLGAHRPRPPLRGLLRGAVRAPPHRHRRLPRRRRRGRRRRRREGARQPRLRRRRLRRRRKRGPAAGGDRCGRSGPLAPRPARDRRVRPGGEEAACGTDNGGGGVGGGVGEGVLHELGEPFQLRHILALRNQQFTNTIINKFDQLHQEFEGGLLPTSNSPRVYSALLCLIMFIKISNIS